MTSEKLFEVTCALVDFLSEQELTPEESVAVLDVTRFSMMSTLSMDSLRSLIVHESEGPEPVEIARWEDDGGAPAVTEKLCGSEFRPVFPAATTRAMERRNR